MCVILVTFPSIKREKRQLKWATFSIHFHPYTRDVLQCVFLFSYDVVPVTYGLGHELFGVSKEGYVDVFDFPDVKRVADFLLYLDSNDSEYNKYFR